jgi:hypothetical protein
MFFTNVFSYANRRRIWEHAYARTQDDLRRRRAELEPRLARFGIRLRDEALAPPPALPEPLGPSLAKLDATLERLDAWLAGGAPAAGAA